MHKVVLVRIGGRSLHLLKLIGAFVIAFGALMLLSSVYVLFSTAGFLNEVNSAGISRAVAVDLNGLRVVTLIKPNDLNSQLGFLLPSLAGIMLWSGVVLFGGLVYKSSGLIPLQEDWQEKKTVKRGKRGK